MVEDVVMNNTFKTAKKTYFSVWKISLLENCVWKLVSFNKYLISYFL